MSYLSPVPFRINVFLPIPGHPNYEISLAGEVRNKSTGRSLAVCAARTSPTRRYLICPLGRLHRLLMSALVGRELRRDEQVRHLDGDPMNNNITNLAIGTAHDNRLDRITSDTYGSRLRNADVRSIRAMFSQFTAAQIAERFGVSASMIRDIRAGRRWSALP